ncbi:hypothetical protein RFI_30570 [Reticulomyxa filosa]|uniref:Viral A-type inclusion protein n=1 Tax=Reticulomyxa filosa TaxID=46433 RepID=X6LZP8_RETFI|nr:hypothetical protein RFI_30570 [Reticulomyxa filosa]|eukprot:ETO06821.1 hypothetical protein RFI_30570 [Reticulomyxa filosa]
MIVNVKFDLLIELKGIPSIYFLFLYDFVLSEAMSRIALSKDIKEILIDVSDVPQKGKSEKIDREKVKCKNDTENKDIKEPSKISEWAEKDWKAFDSVSRALRDVINGLNEGKNLKEEEDVKTYTNLEKSFDETMKRTLDWKEHFVSKLTETKKKIASVIFQTKQLIGDLQVQFDQDKKEQEEWKQQILTLVKTWAEAMKQLDDPKIWWDEIMKEANVLKKMWKQVVSHLPSNQQANINTESLNQVPASSWWSFFDWLKMIALSLKKWVCEKLQGTKSNPFQASHILYLYEYNTHTDKKIKTLQEIQKLAKDYSQSLGKLETFDNYFRHCKMYSTTEIDTVLEIAEKAKRKDELKAVHQHLDKFIKHCNTFNSKIDSVLESCLGVKSSSSVFKFFQFV